MLNGEYLRAYTDKLRKNPCTSLSVSARCNPLNNGPPWNHVPSFGVSKDGTLNFSLWIVNSVKPHLSDSLALYGEGCKRYLEPFIPVSTGTVRIILDEGADLFEIHLIPDTEGEEKIIEDVYVDMLVSVIDENVEKTEDYEKRISEEYHIIEL